MTGPGQAALTACCDEIVLKTKPACAERDLGVATYLEVGSWEIPDSSLEDMAGDMLWAWEAACCSSPIVAKAAGENAEGHAGGGIHGMDYVGSEPGEGNCKACYREASAHGTLDQEDARLNPS